VANHSSGVGGFLSFSQWPYLPPGGLATLARAAGEPPGSNRRLPAHYCLGSGPERLDEEELADWPAGRNAVYQLAALAIGARLVVADG
jgi:hypothetical protein